MWFPDIYGTFKSKLVLKAAFRKKYNGVQILGLKMTIFVFIEEIFPSKFFSSKFDSFQPGRFF